MTDTVFDDRTIKRARDGAFSTTEPLSESICIDAYQARLTARAFQERDLAEVKPWILNLIQEASATGRFKLIISKDLLKCPTLIGKSFSEIHTLLQPLYESLEELGFFLQKQDEYCFLTITW